MKKRIRLTEGQLHNIIRRCINEAVNEVPSSIEGEEAYFTDEKIFGDREEHAYDCICKDGVAIGTLCDDEDSSAPRKIRITYPKLNDVRKNRAMCDEILEYCGLFDLGAKDINYRDIMMCYGKIQGVINTDYSNQMNRMMAPPRGYKRK